MNEKAKANTCQHAKTTHANMRISAPEKSLNQINTWYYFTSKHKNQSQLDEPQKEKIKGFWVLNNEITFQTQYNKVNYIRKSYIISIDFLYNKELRSALKKLPPSQDNTFKLKHTQTHQAYNTSCCTIKNGSSNNCIEFSTSLYVKITR